MKTIIENFDSFQKCIGNSLKRNWPFLFVFCIASCTVHNQINREDFKNIPKNFSGKFYDQLDTVHVQYDNKIFTRSLMKQISNVDNINFSKPIQIDIENKELFLSFEDTRAKRYVLKFYGKHYKNKFVFHTNYETVSFPIVFVTKSMTKYSIYLPSEKEIVFEEHNVNEGMLLLFGAGNSHKSDNKFKLLPNE